MTQQRQSFLGLPIDTGYAIADICNLLGKTGECRLVTFVTADAWAIAAKQPEYAVQLSKMTAVIPAGCDVACAVKKLTGNDVNALCFEMYSLAAPFLKTVVEHKHSLMLVGGEPAIDERVQDKLHITHPDLNIISTVNGYGDVAPKIARVIEKNPDCVLVDFDGQRTDAFLIALKDAGYMGLAIACNGFFAETLQDDEFYPEWVKRWNLCFAYRLLAHPKTLLPKFIGDYPAFAVPVIKAFADKYLPKKAN
ncbi:MAG: WecB/TagA/CpsF family glycosyltransferase [Alphaproteobacteria bacterium]|nr:WecB/TagA/CpsF family glycosyltransferase [Alphaproteobacteria bacterium]